MKKFALLSAAILASIAIIPHITYAKEENKVEHYEAKEFSTVEEALAALISTSSTMASITAQEDLDGTGIEQIHQISYTTENAVAKLNAGKSLADALEGVHLASEEHDVADLKNKFIVYQAELARYLSQK